MKTRNKYEAFTIAHNTIIEIKKLYLKKPTIPFNKKKERHTKTISVKKVNKIIDMYFKELQNT